jgi:hypothetical protein
MISHNFPQILPFLETILPSLSMETGLILLVILLLIRNRILIILIQSKDSTHKHHLTRFTRDGVCLDLLSPLLTEENRTVEALSFP